MKEELKKAVQVPELRPEDNYDVLLQNVKDVFSESVSGVKNLFSTEVSDLFSVFIEHLPEEARQHYTCNACKHFVNRFGNLVAIGDDGKISSMIWNDNRVPEFFKPSVLAMKKIVEESNVKKVFISDERILGIPKTGIWSHLSVTLPVSMVNNPRINTGNQISAMKTEDKKMILNAINEYSMDTIKQAKTLLESETFYRSENCLAIAKWFLDIKVSYDKTKNAKVKSNILWKAAASAPTGFSHIKSGMIGTLLDDIQDGLSTDSVKRRFEEKMSPGNYMRSQSAPTVGNINQAEKIIEKLGLADSLKRRYARYDEIPEFIWESKKNKVLVKQGVFSNITPKEKESKSNVIPLPGTVMTWDKFQRTILPNADLIEAFVDNKDKFMAIVTEGVKDSEKILQWNNPFSWYYHGGIDAEMKRRVELAGGKFEGNAIRCTLMWNNYTDLDLHCFCPSGEIYYGRKRSGDGYLDVDANGGSANTITPVENIRFSDNTANGIYTFRVNNYANRARTNEMNTFAIELEVSGKVYTYHGVAGNSSWNELIFTLHYAKGQDPVVKISGTNKVVTNNNSHLQQWNVNYNDFIKVNAITTSPNTWGDNCIERSGKHTFFLLDGCKDLSSGKGRGLFAETLISELHEVRKTIEAYCANTEIECPEEASACGVGYTKDSDWNLVLRVTNSESVRIIKIDRFD